MNINLKLSRVEELIIENMIKEGYAKNKTEAIKLALITFDERKRTEDELVVRKMQKNDDNINSGKLNPIDSNEALIYYVKYIE